MKFLIFFVLPLFFILPESSESSNANCEKVEFDHLFEDNTIESQQVCADCSFASNANNNANNLRGLLHVPTKSCFTQSIRSTAIVEHSYCSSKPREVVNNRTPLCKTEKYIDRTMNVFNDVVGCVDIQKPEYFFALINRESRFQISARSTTGASCYGQLTGSALSDINGYTAHSSQSVRSFSKQDVQRIGKKSKKQKEACNRVADKWKKITTKKGNKGADAACTLHSNPYTCMLYSALYYQKGVNSAKNIMDKLSAYMAIANDGQQHLFPTKEDYVNDTTLNKSNVKKLKKVSFMENPNEVAHLIALKHYNGGPSVTTLYKSYVQTIKSEIWNKKNAKLANYLFGEAKPDGIATGDFLASFSTYVKKNYPLKNHRKEVAAFGKNVLQDFVETSRDINPACGDLSAQDILTPKPERALSI